MLANGGWDLIQRLTLILITWTIWWAPTNASKWRMVFNSGFKGLIFIYDWTQNMLCMRTPRNYVIVHSYHNFMELRNVFGLFWYNVLLTLLLLLVQLPLKMEGKYEINSTNVTDCVTMLINDNYSTPLSILYCNTARSTAVLYIWGTLEKASIQNKTAFVLLV